MRFHRLSLSQHVECWLIGALDSTSHVNLAIALTMSHPYHHRLEQRCGTAGAAIKSCSHSELFTNSSQCLGFRTTPMPESTKAP